MGDEGIWTIPARPRITPVGLASLPLHCPDFIGMVATSYGVVTPEVPGGGVINTKITEGRLALKWAGAATYLRDVDLIKNQERARLGIY